MTLHLPSSLWAGRSVCTGPTRLQPISQKEPQPRATNEPHGAQFQGPGRRCPGSEWGVGGGGELARAPPLQAWAMH